MVINTVLIIIASFCFLNLVLFFFPIREKESFTNEERAEEYIYSKKNFSTVFVGSGLTGHLPESFYNKEVFNLFLPYSGACSGVEIVTRAAKVPKYLFVETNFIFKGYDRKLIKKLFAPFMFRIKFFFPCLLRKHQVFSMLKQLMKALKKKDAIINNYQVKMDHQRLAQFQNFYNQQFNPRQLDSDIKKLQKHIDYLTGKGCTIIFFEMPMDSSLTGSLLASSQKTELKKVFPEKKYTWVEPNPLTSYATHDGIHLTEESAFRYFTYLKSEWCDKKSISQII